MIKKLKHRHHIEESGGYPYHMLKKAFDTVANPKDWKASICKDIAGGENMDLTIEAIRFFTATEPIIKRSYTPGNVIIMSEGYRMGPAGDH